MSDAENTALTDAAGHPHQPIDHAPRIVSLVPSISELVCDLGLAADLVGRTGFCIHPHAVLRTIPKVGGTKDVDLDKIKALRPTHVILNIDENRREDADALRAFVPHLIVTHPNAPEDNVTLYRLLGGIFRREAQAEALCAELLRAMKACRDAGAGFRAERVLYLIWRDPWMTITRDTYISRTLALVGWHTVPEQASRRYPAIDLDRTLLEQIDCVLLSSEPYRFTARHVEALMNDPALAAKRVALIDGEMTSWYGSRAIAGLAYLPRFRADLEAQR